MLKFIDSSPTAFHAVESTIDSLKNAKFNELCEKDSWDLKENKGYFVVRQDASVIAFRTPLSIQSNSGYKCIGAHTDSPCLKVKNNPTSTREGYHLLNIEIYGGVLLSSWFDRDLRIGGRVITEDKSGNLKSTLVQLPFSVRIPRLAIHLDRGVNNDGFKVNPQTHMFPLLGLNGDVKFEDLLRSELNSNDDILAWELYLFDAVPSAFGGVNAEFIFAPRLDNLASLHASLDAFLSAKNHESDFQIAAYFHNEEIGSNSQNGADSNFTESVLKRINSAFGGDESSFYQRIANSFFISADMAHAVHPNYTEKHDPNHRPYLNKGPVIKSHANMRYATDASSIAKFKQWCHQAEVEYQLFQSKNDIGCGSTIGPMTSAKLGVSTVDIGNPMLSMHSIREMGGSEDHGLLIRVFDKFYQN